MIDLLIESIGKFVKIHVGSKNDDWIDRVIHVITVFILLLFVIFVTAVEFVGEPIHCWCPAEFPDSWIDYSKAVCWVDNTYYIPVSRSIPRNVDERKSKQITYYQWVPVILLIMALLFKLPNIFWRIFNDTSGVNLNRIVRLSEQTQLGAGKNRREVINQIAAYMDRWLRSHEFSNAMFMKNCRHRLSKICFFFCNRKEGTYLTGFYLMVKMFYLAVVLGQFFMLNKALAMDFVFYGQELISSLVTKGEMAISPRFPRETLCDFAIRQMQNTHHYSVHCVLPINLFNEKIFAFLWFWMVFVATITAGSVAFWIWRVFFRQNRVRFTKRKMLLGGDHKFTQAKKQLFRKFANHYLRDDGIFVLRIISKNSTELVVRDLLRKLWRDYQRGILKVSEISDESSCDDSDNDKDSGTSV